MPPNPSRFLFYCDHPNDNWGGQDLVWVSIVREDFWDEHGYVDDRHITADLAERGMDPSFLGEIMDSTFESSLSVELTRARLKWLGFVQDPKFTEFSRTHNPFIKVG